MKVLAGSSVLRHSTEM